jgi:hypothetical protein
MAQPSYLVTVQDLPLRKSHSRQAQIASQEAGSFMDNPVGPANGTSPYDPINTCPTGVPVVTLAGPASSY